MFSKLNFTTLIIAGLLFLVGACRNTSRISIEEKPRIVIGLMVDQMRWDYLYKYRNRYGEGGFKRLLREGFSCENTFIRHAHTTTACGHSSVYTGSVPAINGIVGNSWYDRSWGRVISNVEDTLVKMVGTESREGRSPRNLLTTTIGDELRIATHYQSKVIGVAIKDRAAILPAGHTANGAFWWDDGKFTTSTYYMDTLPHWVRQFNKTNWKDSLMPEGWKTLYPMETYKLSEKDNVDYETNYSGEDQPVFPHTKASIGATPFGNFLTLEFAKAAIEGAQLGEGAFTDLLAVSLSSPDKIGHRFGPNSVEIEDNYLRLDKDLAAFFDYLDKRFGKNGYLFFLTADHGANHSPGYLMKHKIPSGAVPDEEIMKRVEIAVKEKYGHADLIRSLTNGQVYLNYQTLKKVGLNKQEVASFVAEQLKKEPAIANAFPSMSISTTTLPDRVKSMFANTVYPKRAGDVLIMRSAGWKYGSIKGTAHGDWYPYDAHIPLVWMGHGIQQGKTHRDIGMTDIAPTIAAMLNIQMPSGTIGEVITEITDDEE